MTERATGLVALLLVTAICIASTSTARAFYCDGRVVAQGDAVDHVRSVCGAPMHEGTETIIVRDTQRVARGRYVTTITTRTVTVWTYDFGVGRLREQLVIDGGVVTQIRDLGYGGAPRREEPTE